MGLKISMRFLIEILRQAQDHLEYQPQYLNIFSLSMSKRLLVKEISQYVNYLLNNL